MGPREVVLVKDRRETAHNTVVGLGSHGRGAGGSRKPSSKYVLGPVLPSKMPQESKSMVVAVVLGWPKAEIGGNKGCGGKGVKTKKVAKAAVDFLIERLVLDVEDRTLVKELEMDDL